MTDSERMSDEMKMRLDKIERIREMGLVPYAERYEQTHSLDDVVHLEDGETGVRAAGRIVSIRYFGKLAFGHLFDCTGKAQFALQKKKLGEQLDIFKNVVDVGDFIGIEGDVFTTKTGEKTVDVSSWTFLSKALRPLPEKYHGLTDQEQQMRKRYLDLIMSPETMKRFKTRTRIIKTLRNFLDNHEFLEIDTPVLINKASGAVATPFKTHHNALDFDIYLRIAPETYLKRAVAGGFNRVYEFARCFRNEGMDPSHLPDFTMLEYYCAYWNYEDNMDFTEKMIKHLLMEIEGKQEITCGEAAVSFAGSWPRVSFRDLIEKDCGIDIDQLETKDSLLRAVKEKDIRFDDEIDLGSSSRGTLIDMLYKKVSRPKLIDPVFVVKHPIEISPLARKNDENNLIVDRFQLVVNGWEVVNAYSELIDPLDQAERFKQQAAARVAGDNEAMEIDDDFLLCMEYGMPPISGWGMGIDRMVALMTGASTLRDVVLFPLMRSG